MVVFATTFQQGITGFGCTVLALPFVVILLGMDTAVKVMVIQATILSCYIVLTSRRDIIWREYLHIAAFALAGLPAGMVLYRVLSEVCLKSVLGVFMAGVALQGLHAQAIRVQHAPIERGTGAAWLLNGFLVLGGLLHGAFGAGGPLVVVYAAKAIRDKSLFRVTLSVVWLTLNAAMISRWVAAGAITPAVQAHAAACAPFTLLGVAGGDHFHRRVNEYAFRTLVFSVLLLSGLAVLYSAARGV